MSAYRAPFALSDDFLAHTVRDEVYGCLLWQGRKDRDGYGFHGTSRSHIVAYERANGAVPHDQVVDHRCRRRACCAPHHLEAVTRRENELRKQFKYRCAIKRCPRGHAYDETTRIVVPDTMGIVCRTCEREEKGTRA